MFSDLDLDIVQVLVQPPCLVGFTPGAVPLGVPKGKGNVTLATETRRRTVDGDTAHDRNTAIFNGLVLGVEQNSECTPHKLNFLLLQSYYLLSYQRI